MDIEQLIETFCPQDPRSVHPGIGRLVIILGGLLIGIVRGMTGGVLVALLFGGVMSISPLLLGTLETTPPPAVAGRTGRCSPPTSPRVRLS